MDGRSAISKWLRAREQDYIAALGGDPSPQEKVIIGDTVKTMLYVATVDHYLMGLKSLVRKGRVHGVLIERLRLAAHLRENLKTIGLKRIQKTLTLAELLAQGDDGEGQDEDHIGGSEGHQGGDQVGGGGDPQGTESEGRDTS